MPSAAGATYGNSIVPIDPATGTLGTPVFIGSEPNKLAISDDGQFLYVGLDGARAVRRFNLQTQTAGIQFALPSGGICGSETAGDMQVLPGNAHAVAVARFNTGCSPRSDGVTIFDDGVARANSANVIVDSITFGADATVLYGLDSEISSNELVTMTVDASGISVSQSNMGSGMAYGIHFDNGKVYDDRGRTFDPALGVVNTTFSGGTSILTAPSFSVGLPDSAHNAVFLIGSNFNDPSNTVRLYSFDQTHFTPRSFDSIANVSGTLQGFPLRTIPILRLVRWGAQGLAFTTGTNVYMFKTRFLAATPSTTTLNSSAMTPVAGSMVMFTASVNPPAASGSMIFEDDGTPISTQPVSGGTASFSTSALGVGSHTIAAVYSGDLTYQSSTSNLVNEAVTGTPPSFFNIVFEANDLIYNPHDGLLYASVPGSYGTLYGNSIVPIDPTSGALGTPVFIGSEPNRMAISDDGQYLYVGLDGGHAIRRFNLLSQSAELQFIPSTGGICGEETAGDLKVLPGSPHAVAVARYNTECGPSSDGVTIYDDGVARPNSFTSAGVDALTFGNDASVLYGADVFDSSDAFSTMAVSANGLAMISVVDGFYLGKPIVFDNGLVYGSSGVALDPGSGTQVGQYTDASAPNGFEVVKPDSASGRVFFIGSGNSSTSATLYAFDQVKFVELGNAAIPGLVSIPNQYGVAIHRLERWGGAGLAFTTGNQVYNFPTKFLELLKSATQTALATSAASSPAGQSVTLTATVSTTVGVPSGQVQFEDFGNLIGTGMLSGGVATLMTAALAAGPHEITAVYPGDGLHTGSRSNTVDEIITTAGQTATTTALVPSQNFLTGALGQRSVTLTATVTTGSATATGMVSFYAGTRLLGTQPIDNTGTASLTTSELNVGGNEVTAAYSGDTNFAASISPIVVAYRSPKPR